MALEVTEQTPLLRRFSIPHLFTQPGVEQMSDKAILRPDATFPPCAFSYGRQEKNGRKFPQAIAHRGYKAKYPENTMGAFAGAIDIGVHAIETDVHITKDGVVVLSHDATLKRCFGRPEKVIECNWSYISNLETIEEPRQHMPRLLDLLEYLADPQRENTWLLLDIKLDNNPEDIMRLIASTIASVAPSPHRPWNTRIVLGCWAAKYVPLASHHLPGFPVTHIGFSTSYARQFLSMPNVSFNMLLPILMAPGGKKFLADCRAAQRPVLAWTVNVPEKMEWCIRHGLDGVLTDDPKLYLEVCKNYNPDSQEKSLSWWIYLDIFRLWLLATIFGFFYRNRFAGRTKSQVQVV